MHAQRATSHASHANAMLGIAYHSPLARTLRSLAHCVALVLSLLLRLAMWAAIILGVMLWAAFGSRREKG